MEDTTSWVINWVDMCRDLGWAATLHSVEVEHRGFMDSSAIQLLRVVGLMGVYLQRAIKGVAEEAEKASYWLWLRRRDST